MEKSFDFNKEMRIAGRRSALEIILDQLGHHEAEQRMRKAKVLAFGIDKRLNSESNSMRVHPEWAAGMEEIAQALLRIADGE